MSMTCGVRRAALRALACAGLATVILLACSVVAHARSGTGVPTTAPAESEPAPASPYPSPGAGTHFLDDAQLIAGFSEPGWYEANIPFLQVSDQAIQSVYYYRWRTWKEHISQTPFGGQVITEFLPQIAYAAPDDAIVAAAGHSIMEGRWLRDQTYLDSFLRYWLTGPGLASQSIDTYASDWADEYSNWLDYAAYERALVTGNHLGLERLLGAMVAQYDSWSDHLDSSTGLYWQLPVWDAMEQSATAIRSGQPFSGVPTLRPTINAYQYGAAQAIASVAGWTGEWKLAATFRARAARIRAAVQRLLWSPSRQFFSDSLLPDNPRHTLVPDRQETGFTPWYTDLPAPRYSVAWKQLMDPQGFFTAYGPTTLEVRSPLFMQNAYTPGAPDGGCCHWDGPSWPFSTAQTLTALANQLDDYPPQHDITAADYDQLLQIYAQTQMKNGQPYVAEAHSPTQAQWIYDQPDHSEDYNHSTFDDLVISGLIGLRPQAGDTLRLKPLVPPSWSWFCLENVPYHGHNVTVMWDRTGAKYHQGPGLHVYVDGRQVLDRPTIRDAVVHVPPAHEPTIGAKFVDDAVNVNGFGYPQPSATATWPGDSAWYAVDGKVWYDEIPEVENRWTNYQSPNAGDTYSVDFGAAIPLDEIRYYAYCDGGGIQAPASYRVQALEGSTWTDIAGQRRSPPGPTCNTLNRIVFSQITASAIRLVFTNPPGHDVGIAQLEAGSWSSTAASLTVGSAQSQSFQVTPGQPQDVPVTFTNESVASEGNLEVHLDLPPGWSATQLTGTEDPTLAPGATVSQTWRILPAAGATPGGSYAVWAYADFQLAGRPQQTHTRDEADVAFTLTLFSAVQTDDSFSTDDLSSYTEVLPAVTSGSHEVQPDWALGGGLAQASGNSAYFGMLQSGAAPSSAETVAVLDADRFLGDAADQDSMFTGFAADAGDYVEAWYNNVSHTSGIDLVHGGVLDPSGFTNSCCANVTLTPGARLALQLAGNEVTSWVLPAGSSVWQRLVSTSVGSVLDLADPAVRAGYRATFGLRGDSGTLAVSHFFAASDPSAGP